MNVFLKPQFFRDDILANLLLPRTGWRGRSYVVVFPTKYCPVACKHCYFASSMPGRNDEGGSLGAADIERVKQFVFDADTELLQITGGGEPLLQMQSVLELIGQGRARRMLLNTSGLFASSPTRAADTIERIFSAFAVNPYCGKFIFRLSVDEFHLETVKPAKLLNVVSHFRRNFQRYEAANFTLKLHTLAGDRAVEWLLQPLADEVLRLEPTEVVFHDGTACAIGHAPRMMSQARPDLFNLEETRHALDVFDEVRDPTPGAFIDDNLDLGLCFLIHEDGDVELWNTAPADNVANVRSHDFAAVRHSVLGDVIQLGALDHTAPYIEALVAEVDPLSLRRAKSIGSATFLNRRMFAEARLRLYVSLRVIQDYLADGSLGQAQLEQLQADTRAALRLPGEQLRRLYRESGFDIVEQQLNQPDPSPSELIDLYQRLKLGHFDVAPTAMVERVRGATTLREQVRRDFLAMLG